jgi:hypothetical protein
MTGMAMTEVLISPVLPRDVETCAGGGNAAPGMTRWLDLVAAPTFAIMGVVDRLLQWPAGHALHGDAGLIADERNDGDVSVDERFSFIALAETDL